MHIISLNHFGFGITIITESPRINSFGIFLSRFIGFDFWPLLPFGTSVHI